MKKNQKKRLKSQEKNQKSKKSRTPFFQVLYPSRIYTATDTYYELPIQGDPYKMTD